SLGASLTAATRGRILLSLPGRRCRRRQGPCREVAREGQEPWGNRSRVEGTKRMGTAKRGPRRVAGGGLVDTSVDVSDAPNTATRTQLGVADRSAQGSIRIVRRWPTQLRDCFSDVRKSSAFDAPGPLRLLPQFWPQERNRDSGGALPVRVLANGPAS